jgi:SAM-dependent methyltransferase
MAVTMPFLQHPLLPWISMMQTTLFKVAASVWHRIPAPLRRTSIVFFIGKRFAASLQPADVTASTENIDTDESPASKQIEELNEIAPIPDVAVFKEEVVSATPLEANEIAPMPDVATAWRERVAHRRDYLSEPAEYTGEFLKSGVCTELELRSEAFQAWGIRMGDRPGHMHRKIWEWAFIAQALSERGLLQAGKLGLGFAVGTEPLTALFASAGTNIVATDLYTEDAQAKGWVDSDQHAKGLEAINVRKLCDQESLRSLVEFKFADMNDISHEFDDQFDFVWSSCAFEHLGSIENGKAFVHNAMRCLKPGGFAVHTTEFNLSSNTDTVDTGSTVLFRKQDIEEIIHDLRANGHTIEIEWNEGDGYADGHVDVAPYAQETHLRLQIQQYVVTSIGIIIQKSE